MGVNRKFAMGMNRKFDFRQDWQFYWDLSNVISSGKLLFRWDCFFRSYFESPPPLLETPLRTMQVGLCNPLQTMWFPYWYTGIDAQILALKKEKYTFLYTDIFFSRLFPQFKIKKDDLLELDYFIKWFAAKEECIWPSKSFSK